MGQQAQHTYQLIKSFSIEEQKELYAMLSKDFNAESYPVVSKKKVKKVNPNYLTQEQARHNLLKHFKIIE